MVYDMTKFLDSHPGGPEILLELAGNNADSLFEDIGHSSEARQFMKDLLIGKLKVLPALSSDASEKISEKSVEKKTEQLLSDEQKISSSCELHWISKDQIICDRTEVGSIFPHQHMNIEHTMSMWVWLPHDSLDGHLLVKKGLAEEAHDVAWSSIIIGVSKGYLYLTISDGMLEDGFKISSASPLVSNRWVHIAYSVNMTDKTLALYVDGYLSNEIPLSKLMTSRNINRTQVTQVIETKHNYDDNMDKYWPIKISGGFLLFFIFLNSLDDF